MINLDNLIIPQSPANLELLHNLVLLTKIILYPYLAFLFGSLFLSLFFQFMNKKKPNDIYATLASDMIDLVTLRKSVALGLGVIPILSLGFCYLQYLAFSQNLSGLYLMIFSVIFLVTTTIIFLYKHLFHLSNIFTKVENNSDDEFKTYKSLIVNSFSKLGMLGFVLLMASIFIILSLINTINFSDGLVENKSFFAIFINPYNYFEFIAFVAISVLAVCIYYLYLIFRPNTELKYSEIIRTYIKTKFSFIAISAVMILPLMLVIKILLIDEKALSFMYFGLSLAVVLVLFYVAHILYGIMKHNKVNLSLNLFLVLFILFFLEIYRENIAAENSTKYHQAFLETKYNQYVVDFKSQFGIAAAEISGEDIYKGKCVACHAFDKKIVGPAYKDVLPKYEGKIEDLAEYILNPTKVDPNFPVMPSQGLKPNQAKAVAEYIVSKYK